MSPRRYDGHALSGRYELQTQIGSGGMAEVYLARDNVLGRTVAVKILLDQYAGDPHFIERFRREAQNAAALNHPNVVSVYDTGSDDGTHYIVMEYVEGRTLRDAIREEGPLLSERVAEIGAEVCAGMSFAHQHGIVHRDIKPANIMLTMSGGVKVADFGIARAVSGDTVTQTAMVLGTAQYFSPEQAQSQPVDARSDLYSLGVVLYEMLTRQVPFTGSSPVAIAYKHVKEPPMLPSRLNPDVPPALEAIVVKALAKNPDNRYQSADEMRDDLLRALQGRPVEAPPVLTDMTGLVDMGSADTIVVERGPSTKIRRERGPEEKRRRTGMILLGVIIAAILATAVWAFIGLTGGSKTGEVPNVVGETVTKAEERLSSQGFQYFLLDPVPSDTVAAGLIASQDPAAGTANFDKSKPVRLTPSGGPELVKVPDVTGKTRSDAISALKAAGFIIGDVTEQEDNTIRRGHVISQSPSGDAFAKKGGKVNLVVSSGPPTTRVPSVIGFTQDDARNRIESEGFVFGSPIYEPQSADCPQTETHVCRQDPEAGSLRRKGSTVTVVIATAPVEESPTPTAAQCSDGVDNDGDGKIDFPADPGCTDPTDNDETG